MKVEIEYYEPDESSKSPRCYLRLFPDDAKEMGEMDTLLSIFIKTCTIEKALVWEQTHYIITLHAPEVVTNG